MYNDSFDNLARIKKGFDGLEISIPSKICLICMLNFTFILAIIYFQFNLKIDFNNLNIFVIFGVLLLVQSFFTMIYASFVKEKIVINHSSIKIMNNFFGYRRSKKYDISGISNFELIENAASKSKYISVAKFYFKHKNSKKPIRFASNLPFEEAKEFYKQIIDNKYIPEDKLHHYKDNQN